MNTKNFLYYTLLAVVAIFFALPLGLTVQAQSQDSSLEANIVDEAFVYDDMYLSEESLSFSDYAEGDLVAAARDFVFDGQIGADIAAAAFNMQLSGSVGDDVRVFALRDISVDGLSVGDDMIIIGAETVNISYDKVISGDLVINAATVYVDGIIEGDILLKADTIIFNGSVAGESNITAIDLVVGQQANLTGATTYTSPNEATIDDNAVVGAWEYTPVKQSRFFFGLINEAIFILIVMGLVSNALLKLIIPSWLEKTFMIAKQQHWKVFLKGLAVFIGLPVASGLLVVLALPMPLAMVLLSAFTLFAFLALSMVGIFVGAWMRYWILGTAQIRSWTWMIIGTITAGLLAAIPVIGPWIAFLLIIFAMGSFVQFCYETFQKSR
jgi:cytoskeletal protein CcmA (bactofilin family)